MRSRLLSIKQTSRTSKGLDKTFQKNAPWTWAAFFLLVLLDSVASGSPFAQPAPTADNLLQYETRAANSYSIERAYNTTVCPDILEKLNKAYWMPRGLRMPADYAEIESNYYLGTHEGTRWTKVALQFVKTREVADVASVDLFNTGEPTTVIRKVWTVSSRDQQVLYLGKVEGGRWSTTEVRFRPFRERDQRIQENLSTGFNYSVTDVISSEGRTYVLLKPTRDFIRDARIYVLRAFGVMPADGGADYDLICTLTMR